MFSRVWIIGFAGHRRVENPVATRAAILAALKDFKASLDGVVTGRASAAAGADLLFLEACRELGISYSVVLPFPEDLFAADFQDQPAEWARSRELIAGARSVEIAPGNEPAPAAYHLAAREVLDVADAMLFFWDGQPARGIGGTEESIAEARSRGLPHRIIEAAGAKLGPLEGGVLSPTDPDFATLPVAPSVEMLFGELDLRAMRGAPRSRYFAALSISLNQAATLTYAVLVAFGLGVDAAPAVKFLIVTVAALLPWVGSRTRIHEVWVEDRLRAELLRSLLASHAFAPPLRPFAADLFVADASLLRSASWHLAPERQPWEKERDRYLSERLEGQISYLRAKGEYATGRLRRLELIFRLSSAGAMVLGAAAILKAIFHWQVNPWFDRIALMFLPIVLPAVAAWCMAMIPLFEHKRRSGLYRQLVDRLAAKRLELIDAKCFTTASRIVASCERLLLTEVWEWGGSRGQRR